MLCVVFESPVQHTCCSLFLWVLYSQRFFLQVPTAVLFVFSGAVVSKHLYICIHATLDIMFLLSALYVTVGTFYWLLKTRQFVGYKGGIIKYLLQKDGIRSDRSENTCLRATQYGYLLVKVSFILPFNKCLLKYLLRIRHQRGCRRHKNTSSKGVPVLSEVTSLVRKITYLAGEIKF